MKHESPQVLKQTLSNIISEMQTSLDLFVMQPGKDFVRNRKLTFSQTVKFFLSMGGNTVRKELLDFFDYSSYCVSASAFSQQRAKILPEAMDFCFIRLQNLLKDFAIIMVIDCLHAMVQIWPLTIIQKIL